jgi:hypothetical protein
VFSEDNSDQESDDLPNLMLPMHKEVKGDEDEGNTTSAISELTLDSTLRAKSKKSIMSKAASLVNRATKSSRDNINTHDDLQTLPHSAPKNKSSKSLFKSLKMGIHIGGHEKQHQSNSPEYDGYDITDPSPRSARKPNKSMSFSHIPGAKNIRRALHLKSADPSAQTYTHDNSGNSVLSGDTIKSGESENDDYGSQCQSSIPLCIRIKVRI